MAIADVPDSPLSLGFDASTDTITPCGLCCHLCFDALHGSKDHRVSLTLLNDETVADLMGCGHVVRKFAHESIIRGQGRSLGVMVDSSGIEQQSGDCFDSCLLCLYCDPCHRFAFGGALPDHHVLIVGCCQLVGVGHVRCPLATPLVKGAPCFRLDCDGVVHAFRLIDLIIEARPRPMAMYVDSLAPVPTTGR